MGEVKPKEFEYSVEIGRNGSMALPGEEPVAFAAGWTADHLLLAALVRCSIHSLAYHAELVGSSVVASGSASGRVARREGDGRYAFVEISCSIEASFSPPVDDSEGLTADAERDCFVGASLVVKPQYHWLIG